MSHFTVLVDTTNSSLEEQLEPFDENEEVKPYLKDCYCSRHNLSKRVTKELEKLFGGSFDEVKREPYNAMDKSVQPEWTEWIADWVEKEKELEVKFAKFRRPSKDCSNCHGTGKYETTYNQDSKWDWYSIGGRWAGYFTVKSGVEPERGEPSLLMDNFEYEDLGADIVQKKDIDLDVMKKRQMKNIEERWSKKDEPFMEVPKKITKEQYMEKEMKKHPLTPFAFIDSNGEWHEKAEMGWWGMTSNDKAEEAWEAEFTEWFNGLPEDTELTAVDCHI